MLDYRQSIVEKFTSLFSVIVGISLFFVIESNVFAIDVEVLPDLRTVVPAHLQLVNEHQREVLRFSNGIANTGDGFWQLRPEFPLDDPSQPQRAYQMLLDADGNTVREVLVGEFQYHPTHNHWHVANVAEFSVHAGSPDGPLVGQTIKSSFCLLDLYKLDDNSPTHERTYWYCEGGFQGVSPGWADQYHQSTDGQQIDITGAPPGIYYLVSKTDPDGIFVEENPDNNDEWVKIQLKRDSKDNPKISILGHSDCESPGLCGERSTNR
jgi:hypothetical protein